MFTRLQLHNFCFSIKSCMGIMFILHYSNKMVVAFMIHNLSSSFRGSFNEKEIEKRQIWEREKPSTLMYLKSCIIYARDHWIVYNTPSIISYIAHPKIVSLFEVHIHKKMLWHLVQCNFVILQLNNQNHLQLHLFHTLITLRCTYQKLQEWQQC